MLSGDWRLPKTLEYRQAGMDEEEYEEKMEELVAEHNARRTYWDAVKGGNYNE